MQEMDRRTRKTRKAISDAFWKLMQEKDFDEITISDITNAADIHRATFYLHYQDKYDWLQRCVEEILDVHRTAAHKAVVARQVSYEEAFRYFDENFDKLSILVQNVGAMFFQETYTRILVDYFRELQKNPDSLTTDMDFSTHFVSSAIVGSILWWIKNDRPLSPEEMGKKMSAIYQGFPEWMQL